MRLILVLLAALCAVVPAWSRPPPPCEAELRSGSACQTLTDEALSLFAGRENRSGAFVIEDVRSGAIVAASSYVIPDDPTPPARVWETVLPLSTTKLFVAASLWSRGTGKSDPALDARIIDMIKRSDDAEGKRLANELREEAGTAGVLADLARYGMPRCTLDAKDTSFWGAARVPEYMVPVPSCTTLDDKADAETWGAALSLGEANFSTTLLHLTRFMQAIGNNGVMVTPRFREADQAPPVSHMRARGAPIMTPAVAAKMRNVLLATVQGGTGRGVKDRMRGGWKIGGKTGTAAIHGEPFDGVFLGLIFDPKGQARYAFAVYVQHGGKGGGTAAEIACDLFNYVLGL